MQTRGGTRHTGREAAASQTRAADEIRTYGDGGQSVFTWRPCLSHKSCRPLVRDTQNAECSTKATHRDDATSPSAVGHNAARLMGGQQPQEIHRRMFGKSSMGGQSEMASGEEALEGENCHKIVTR